MADDACVRQMTDLSIEDGVIVLPARIDMSVAGALRDTILSTPGDIALDAGSVNLIATPAVQVLMAARDHQRAQGKTLQITNMSDGFYSSLATLGITADRLLTAEDVR